MRHVRDRAGGDTDEGGVDSCELAHMRYGRDGMERSRPRRIDVCRASHESSHFQSWIGRCELRTRFSQRPKADDHHAGSLHATVTGGKAIAGASPCATVRSGWGAMQRTGGVSSAADTAR